jgi:hypothetical protein
MAQTALPYFGTTTDGLQVFTVPKGTVLRGAPVVVPESPEESPPNK